MVVYGPHEDTHKLDFLQEMHNIRCSIADPGIILVDFNLILQAQNKNNNRLNMHLTGTFRRVLDDLELKEIHLNDQAFTWSSAREIPTLEHIDRVFVSTD